MTEPSVKEKAREEIPKICRSLHEKGFLAAGDGNVSFRLDDGRILMTPSGVAKAKIKETDLALLSADGEVLEGRPSSEKLMHLAVYKNSKKAKAVVHAHPPCAIAWSVAKPDLKFLPDESISELILAVGAIPFVPYARPGTSAMGENLLPFLNEYRAMILSRHGVLCWGESLEEAYNGVERIEHSAMTLHLAEQLGGITSLPQDEVEALREMRKTMGEKIL